MSSKQRELWVDTVKAYACILVVLGHFFQSMVKASILPDNGLYHWFNSTIYYFHVPLFFICSGYLYQKYSHVDDLRSWGKNVWKKLVVLGIPYFVFSIAEWVLKNKFSSSVNTQTGGLLDSLFIHPLSPYWYLYSLFFLFVLIPVFKKEGRLHSCFAIAVALKIISCFVSLPLPLLQYLFSDAVWFVGGMEFAFLGKTKDEGRRWYAAGLAFIVLSVFTFRFSHPIIGFCMGLLACISTVGIIHGARKINEAKPVRWFAQYTMPVFLMHTLCAAPVRVLLLKFGISNPAFHVICGVAISFIGPIILIKIMEKCKLDILFYPNRYVKF